MIQLMAGMTDAAEAAVALAHGADIVDVMAGAADAAAIVRAISAAGGGRAVSATASGETPAQVADAARALAQAGAQYVKVHLPAGPEREALIRSLAPLAARVSFVGVIFADGPSSLETAPALAQAMAECGFAGAMLDIAPGTPGRLLERLDLAALQRFIHAFHLHNMLAGLAGALEAPDVPRLAPLAPDILAFRRALCASGGRGQLDGASIEVIRALIGGHPAAAHQPQPREPEETAPAQSAASGRPTSRPGATDRVFVHDFVLPVRIGAYGREHHQPQRVRFGVDVLVDRSDKRVEDMRDVFSYDVITDGIRMLVAGQHIRFVETLAERIAELLLAHPRVAGVTVRIEKLDIGPGAVGVEIVRTR